ncbi:MAG: class I tRNA ligase family protein, partial [Bacilli bacterium]|nr:class I tRNA ligase family protein [Bacilli bacterium]
ALNSNDESLANNTRQVLVECLKNIILLIYPYTPFIAEELYISLPSHKDSIMEESYPKYDKAMVVSTNDNAVNLLLDMVKDVRNYKVENKLAPNAKLELKVHVKLDLSSFGSFTPILERFTFSTVSYVKEEIINMKGELRVYDFADLLIVNEAGKDELIKRIDKEIELEQNEIIRGEKMLNNPNFINKAPADKIELERNKLIQHKENLASLIEKKNKLL